MAPYCDMRQVGAGAGARLGASSHWTLCTARDEALKSRLKRLFTAKDPPPMACAVGATLSARYIEMVPSTVALLQTVPTKAPRSLRAGCQPKALPIK